MRASAAAMLQTFDKSLPFVEAGLTWCAICLTTADELQLAAAFPAILPDHGDCRISLQRAPSKASRCCAMTISPPLLFLDHHAHAFYRVTFFSEDVEHRNDG